MTADPCPRCGTRPDKAIASYKHADGRWSHIMIDEYAPAPTIDFATVICPVDLRRNCKPPTTDTYLLAAMERAVKQWGRNVRMIERYLRIWHGVAAVGWIVDDQSLYVGAMTHAVAEEWECTDKPTKMIHRDLRTYMQWVKGEVWGVVSAEADGADGPSQWESYGYETPRALAEAFNRSPITHAWEKV